MTDPLKQTPSCELDRDNIANKRDRSTTAYIDIVFDGPPDHNAPRFIEVEDDTGRSISAGEWLQRPDGYWVLRIPQTGGKEG